MHLVHCTPPHPSRPHCWQVRQRTARRINILTPTVQNEIISNNYVTALYMLYRAIYGDPVTRLPQYKIKSGE